MERDTWLMVLVGLVVMAGPLFIFVALFLLGAGLDTGSSLPRTGVKVDVVLDPLRAGVGLGAAALLVGAAAWVVKRTDWSLPGS